MNTSTGNRMIGATAAKNPLLLSPVITNILEMLPLREIKRVRLVCREWNSHAEPLLRKKAKIVFSRKFITLDYFECYSESRLSDLPFTAFKFTCWDGDYLVADLDYFFNKCGKNIKSLELDGIHISKSNYDLHLMKTMNINPWIELLPDNMDKLTISGGYHSSTRLPFNLEKLRGVKSLSLSLCDVIVNSSNKNRIAPSEITMKAVKFLNQSEEELHHVVLNDFVDFSKCSNIKIERFGLDNDISFDMSKDIVNAKNVEFSKIEVVNSGFSKVKTDFLKVISNPPEAIKIQVRQLDIESVAPINLTDLPQRVEKLTIRKSLCVPEVTVPLDLPNLKYFNLDEPYGEDFEGSLRVLEPISWFKNCSNLVDVHLGGLQGKCWLDIAWLPRSINRLKLTNISETVFFSECQPINIAVLLLDDSINSSAVEMLTETIIPKTLVKIVAFHKRYVRRGSERAVDFISFIRKNTQFQKIVINMRDGLGFEDSSGRNRFLQFVGEESLCYEFNNQIGKAISKEKFGKYYDINYILSAE